MTSLATFCRETYIPEKLYGSPATTWADYASVSQQWILSPVGAIAIENMTAADIGEYLRWQRNRPRTIGTVNHHRRVVLALLRFAKRRGLRQDVPEVDRLREPKRIPRAWTVDELAELLRAAGSERGNVFDIPARSWWPPLLLTLFDTGLRINPTMHAERKHLSSREGWLFVPAEVQKHRADQQFQLHQQTLHAIEAMANTRRKIFPWPYDPGPGWKVLVRHFRRIIDRAGLPQPDKPFHRLRRTTGSYVADKLGISAAQEQLGHSCQSVTKTYLDPRLLHRVQAIDILPRPKFNGEFHS